MCSLLEKGSLLEDFTPEASGFYGLPPFTLAMFSKIVPKHDSTPNFSEFCPLVNIASPDIPSPSS